MFPRPQLQSCVFFNLHLLISGEHECGVLFLSRAYRCDNYDTQMLRNFDFFFFSDRRLLFYFRTWDCFTQEEQTHKNRICTWGATTASYRYATCRRWGTSGNDSIGICCGTSCECDSEGRSDRTPTLT